MTFGEQLVAVGEALGEGAGLVLPFLVGPWLFLLWFAVAFVLLAQAADGRREASFMAWLSTDVKPRYDSTEELAKAQQWASKRQSAAAAARRRGGKAGKPLPKPRFPDVGSARRYSASRTLWAMLFLGLALFSTITTTVNIVSGISASAAAEAEAQALEEREAAFTAQQKQEAAAARAAAREVAAQEKAAEEAQAKLEREQREAARAAEAERQAQEEAAKEQAKPPAPAPAPPAPAPYTNCTEAHQNGAHDIPRGDPRYGPHLDRNGDGVACES